MGEARMAGMKVYRDHLSVTTWIVLASLTMGLLLQWPERVYTLWAFGSPIDLRISGAFVAGLVALAATWAGTEAVLRTHPRAARLRHTYRFWGLPSAMTLTGATLLPTIQNPSLWLLILAAVGTGLAVSIAGEYHTVDREEAAYAKARWLLNILAYLLAGITFVLIYLARSRSLVSATLIALVAGMLAMDLLRDSSRGTGEVMLSSGLIAFLLAQITVLLNYWPFPTLRVALLLLMAFYLMVGLVQTHLRGHLTFRRALEYLTISGVVVAIIVLFPK